MWSTLRHLISGAISLSAMLASLPAHAEDGVPGHPRIEISRRPLVIEPAPLNQPRSFHQLQALAEDWSAEYARDFPLVQLNSSDTSTSSVGLLGPNGTAALSRLVGQVVRFADGISSDTRTYQSSFRAQFLHVINEQMPGLAWFVEAEQTSFDGRSLDVTRTGGGVGVQVPILGSRRLTLTTNTGQLVLRAMPLAGTFETINVGTNPIDRTPDPANGITIRPAVEAEATFQLPAGIRPGARFFYQPRILQPNEARMIAEVFVNFDITPEGSTIHRVSIIPRCMVSLSTDQPPARAIGTTQNEDFISLGHRLLNQNHTCSLSASIDFDD